MRFGSVQFFKVLIKTVLAVVFFAPLIAAVVLSVFLVNKNKELESVKAENISLAAAADVLVGAKAGTAEDLYTIVSRSNIDYNKFLGLLYKNDKLTAGDIYDTLSGSGVADKDIISIAASKKTVNGEQFYEIMSKNGISDKDLIVAVLNKNGSDPDKLRALLKECGLSDAQIAAIAGVKPQSSSSSSSNIASEPTSGSSGGSSSSSSSSSSSDSGPQSEPPKPAYMSLYPDLYVAEPAEYVREDGTVYLTFDDGPSQYTDGVLTYLRLNNVKATFFVVPNRSEACAQTLKKIASEGHTIGVHSATHEYEKIYASVDAFLEDFYEAWDIVRDATGVETPVFRFPGGSKNDFNVDTRDDIINEMTRRGFRFFDWNVQSNDILADTTWTDMYSSIPRDVKNLQPRRSVVLFHDTSYKTVLVIDDVIKVLKNEGYKLDKINDNTMPVQFIGPFS